MGKTFLEESNEWLNPYGYTNYYTFERNGEVAIMYSHKNEHYPVITCKNSQGDKSCEIQTTVSKLMLILTSQGIRYKYPGLQKYIDVFIHHSEIAERFPYRSFK